MLTAVEALNMSRQNDMVAQELELVEEEIRSAASKGDTSTSWYAERLTDSQILTLIYHLRGYGYYVNIYNKQKKIYIGWSDAK